ncbi:MAG TPA: 4-phosphoerythronate dehydrogenase [Bacteroidota bacterium]
MKERLPTIVVNKNTPFVFETFSPLGNVRMLETNEVNRDAVQDADILIVRSETRVDGGLLEGSSVRFVGTPTIGTDHIDLEYLKSRGVAFASAPGSNANSVAEYIAAALLVWADRNHESLATKTIGIVGVGNVGSKVDRVARILGMSTILNDPPRARESGDPVFRGLEETLQADIVSIHVPLTRSGEGATWHLFDASRIRMMKKGSVLMNTSRGPVVDTGSLARALSAGQVSAAILDVWENEPAISVELLDRVFLGSPHIAGYSLDGKLNALRTIHDEVCRFLNTPPENLVDGIGMGKEPRIMVSDHVTEELVIVRETVRQAYDIELDDYMLRKITELPDSERPAYFARLRSTYRIRREFGYRTVELLPEQSAAGRILRELGFRVNVKVRQHA